MQVLPVSWVYKVVGAFTAALTASVVSVSAQAGCDSSQVPADRAPCSAQQSAVVQPFTLQQQLDFSIRFTGKERLTLLSQPRALNPEIQGLIPKLDGLNEAVDILLGAGLYTQAAEYEKQAMELFNNISLMIANQAVNEAVYYNAPARLEAVLSGTSLGPVRVRAHRTVDEVVVSITTPDHKPLGPQLTHLTHEELSRIVRELVSPPVSDKDQVSGIANVVDGDTLELRGDRIRLHGVDAPESEQLCAGILGDLWRCGQQAALALADRIGRRPVSCDVRDVDRYGRKVAVCEQSGEDLNRWLVSEGWAVAYRQYSTDYVSDEEGARRAGRNIWAGRFIMPWDWRRGQRLQ